LYSSSHIRSDGVFCLGWLCLSTDFRGTALSKTTVLDRLLDRLADEVMPSIAAVPYWPSGALAAVCTDLSGANFTGQAAHADVVIELIPTPVVRTQGGI